MRLERRGDVGIIFMDTERNNSYNLDAIREANEVMDAAEHDDSIRSVVVTSSHKSMFCPGADLPTLMEYSRAEIHQFFTEMTDLIRRKFTFPKPEVYALNGHTIAGGYTLALTGEYRIMADGPFKVGMMEINVGLPAPKGPAEMFNYVLGGHQAGNVLFGGETYSPRKACEMGLIDEVVEAESLMDRATEKARLFGGKPAMAYRRLKRYLRGPVAERMKSMDESHMDDMVDQWFEEETQILLKAALKNLTMSSKAATH